MGLYKRCEHAGTKNANSCAHDWWGQYMHKRTNHRINLTAWSGETLDGKQKADVIYQRMREDIRTGKFRSSDEGPRRTRAATRDERAAQMFGDVIESYVKKHIAKARGKGSESRARAIGAAFDGKTIHEITTDDVEDWLDELREEEIAGGETRTVATVNRYISMARHVWSWAQDRAIIDSSPFYRGQRPIIRNEPEDNKRHRRLDPLEEASLIMAASPHIKPAIACSIESGLRLGELRRLEWRDVAEREGWIKVRGTDDRGHKLSKSGKTRWVPATERFAEMIAPLRTDDDAKKKRATVCVFSYGDSTPMGEWRTAFELSLKRAGIVNLRWHDLRHEYASRLVDDNVPVAQVQQLLGHAHIETTMRYVNVTDESLRESVQRSEASRKTRKAAG